MSTDSNLTTVDRIMNAALLMVQQRGFHGFSFRDLASEVGIKSASIHYHFPTKPDLARAVLLRVREAFEQELHRIDDEEDTVRGKLSAFANIFITTYADGDRLCPFCMVACAQRGVPDDVRAEVQAFWARGECWVEDVLNEPPAISRGRNVAAGVQARAFVAGLEGAMVTARAFEQRQRLIDAAGWWVETLSAGTGQILPEPAAAVWRPI